MAWAALGKAAVGAVKGGAKKIAADKLLNRSKKKKPQKPQQEGVEQEKGGALAVRPTTSLMPTGPTGIVSSPGGALATTDSGAGGGETAEEIASNISSKLITVDNLLKGSALIKKDIREDARIAREKASDKKQEAALEKAKPPDAKKGPKLNLPGKGLLAKVFGFLGSIILGWIAVRLVDWLPKLMPVIGILGKAVDGIITVAGWILDGLTWFIDKAYVLYDAATGWIKNLLGEEGAKKFDIFMGNLKNLIQAFLVWKIIGEKIFKAIISSIKNTWKIIKGAFTKAFKIAKAALKAAWNLISKIPGVKQAAGKVLQAGKTLLGAGKVVGQGILQAGKDLFKIGAGKVTGLMAKFLGPASKALGPVMKTVGPKIAKFAGRIPVLGPIIVAVISIMSGESIGQALFKGIGAALGGALGATLAAAITTATVGLGALFAPAMTMLGELLGTFVGDLLYEGFMGNGWGAALDKLKGAVGGIFKAIAGAGEAVINFFKDGFGRLIENFPTVPIPDFRPGDIVANLLMKFPGGLDILGLEVPKWVPFIGGASVIGFLQGLPGLQEVLGFFAQFMPGMDRYIEGGRLLAIPNLLMLTPVGLPFLAPTIAKSFLPGIFGEPSKPDIPTEAPKAPEKVSASSIRAESKKRKEEAARKQAEAIKKKLGELKDAAGNLLKKANPMNWFAGNDSEKEKPETKEKPSMLTGGMLAKGGSVNLHKGEIVIDPDSAGPAKDMLLAINQADSYAGIVEAIRAFAPYEALEEAPSTSVTLPSAVSPTPTPSGGSGLLVVGGDKGEDPFEALDFFG